jgi:hypothetical protein
MYLLEVYGLAGIDAEVIQREQPVFIRQRRAEKLMKSTNESLLDKHVRTICGQFVATTS